MMEFIKILTFVPRFSNLFIILSIVIVFVPSVPLVNSAKILAVFPHIGKSHQDVFQPLVDGLAEKGHDVVVVSFFPKKEPVENYTDIVLDSGKMSLMYNSLPIHIFKGIQGLGDFFQITDIGMQCCEMVLSSEPVKNLINSDHKFDLIITELFQIDCFLGFVHRFKAPFIALSSSVLLPTASDRFGNPDNPAFIPNVFLTHSDRMDYFQRFYNTFATVAIKFIRTYYYDVAAEKIARKYFGPSLPPLHEIAKNTSLVLVNSHPTLNRPRPLAPAVIDVGGMHIKPEKKLPQDLQEYLDESSQGVILFSMGSTLLTHTFPEEKRNMIMEAFAEMPQNVLCKWENDTLPNKPNNVKILKWLPQRDILAHPNVIAFVSHGGLLGTTEAVFCGVPVVTMPMYGDQGTNSRAIEASGAGIFLSYSKLTKEIFHKALTKIVSKTYRDKAKRLSELYRDRPLPPLQTALFWTEHVLRFGGCEHIRLATVSMPWYQCVLLDVILGAAVILISVMYVVFLAAQKLTALIISKDVIGKCINNEKKIK